MPGSPEQEAPEEHVRLGGKEDFQDSLLLFVGCLGPIENKVEEQPKPLVAPDAQDVGWY